MTGFEGCSDYGWNSDDIVRLTARVRPAGVGTNGSTLRINIFAGTYAYHLSFFDAVGGLPEGEWVDADAVAWVGSGAGFTYLPSGNTAIPRIYLLETPNFLNNDRTRIALNAMIENFDYLPGCSAFASLVFGYTE